MKTLSCQLCHDPVQHKQGILCEACLGMEERPNYLIQTDKERVNKYLGNKSNAIANQENRNTDRRKTPYQPPWGNHTPERRVKIRRQRQQPGSPRRRKSDWNRFSRLQRFNRD